MPEIMAGLENYNCSILTPPGERLIDENGALHKLAVLSSDNFNESKLEANTSPHNGDLQEQIRDFSRIIY